MADISRQDFRTATEGIVKALNHQTKATAAVASMLRDIRDELRNRSNDDPLQFLEGIVSALDPDEQAGEPGSTYEQRKRAEIDRFNARVSEAEQRKMEVERRLQMNQEQPATGGRVELDEWGNPIAQPVDIRSARVQPVLDEYGNPIPPDAPDSKPESYLDDNGVRHFVAHDPANSVNGIQGSGLPTDHYALTAPDEDYLPIPEDEQWRIGH